MDSYKVFQGILLALVLLSVSAEENKDNDFCDFKGGPPKVRLEGDKNGEGRPEVLCSGTWGTFSADHWDDKATTVFCREAGFDRGEQMDSPLNGTVPADALSPVLRLKCSSEKISMTQCNIEMLSEIPGNISSYFGLTSYEIDLVAWDHNNDVMLKCFQPQGAEFSKSSVQQIRRQSNVADNSVGRVSMEEANSGNITWLLLSDGIEFVLLLVAVVVTSLIVYRQATHKLRSALKESRPAEAQNMLQQVTVQEDTRREDPLDEQPEKSTGATIYNPCYE